jgi:dihydrofolate reductase
MVSIICAMDSKRGIGKDGSIPWHIPEDFKHFKEKTMGHSMIMGRRTFESLGRILPGRVHIVITHDVSNKTSVEGLIWTNSLENAIEIAEQLNNEAESSFAKASEVKEIFIIGGGEIFKEALEKNLVDKMYLTIIEARLDSSPDSTARQGDFEADTFFPEYSGFKEVKSSEHDNGKYEFSFHELIIKPL